MAEDDDFLSRWSRRKRAVEAEDLTPEPTEVTPVVSVDPAENEEAEDEDVLLERLGLPSPETLKEGDDFSAFMQAGVPEFLRKRALRVLWRSNPVLANLDGLNDYDDDFNSPELTQKVLATGYQVGRGFVKKVLEATPEGEELPSEEEPLAAVPQAEQVAEKEAEIMPDDDQVAVDPDEENVAPRPRRMRFDT